MKTFPGLTMVRAENPSPMTLDGTRTFVVGARRLVIIDPGPDDAQHLAKLLEVAKGGRVEAILLTHIHPDHAAGAESLADRLDASVWRGRGAAEQWPAVHADHWLKGDDEFVTDRGLLRAIATPGHSPDHHAFHWTGAPDGGNGVFVGDLLMGEGDTTLVAAPEGDLSDYLQSLERVAALDAERLFPAHGPIIADAAAAIVRYRRHRAERIEQVRALIRERGRISASEMVKEIYGAALDPALEGAAEASVMTILAYLDAREDAS